MTRPVSVVDLEAKPIRIADHITVGDSPEGLVISPKGNLAVTIEANGSNQPKDTWYYHPGGTVGVLRIDGKNVTRVGAVTVGALPEGAASSADGNYLYVATSSIPICRCFASWAIRSPTPGIVSSCPGNRHRICGNRTYECR